MKRPFVTANFAITADGRISTRKMTPADFSSKRDKFRLQEIRAKCDAVLVGARTVSTDTMTMGLPDKALRAARVKAGKAEYPVRVLVSNSGRISPALRVFEKTFSPVVLFSTCRMPLKIRAELAAKADLNLSSGPAVDLAEMLGILRREYAVKRLVCEGGAMLFRSLLEADFVDELHLTLVPRIFGGRGAPTVTGPAGEYLARSTRLRLRQFEVEGGECFLRYTVER